MEGMTNPRTDLPACTDEELQRALACMLGRARAEVPNDAEVRKLYQVYEEIHRRALAVLGA
jgi:hypothetical protein